jgi:hypothetical protein
VGGARSAAGQLGHHFLGVHARGQHVAVVAVAGDDLVAFAGDRLHADGDGFLADVEMAEAADQAHPIQLAGPLLEAADQQHFAIPGEHLLLGRARGGFLGLGAGRGLTGRGLRGFRFLGASFGGVGRPLCGRRSGSTRHVRDISCDRTAYLER